MNKHFQVFRNVIIPSENAADFQELVLLFISRGKGRPLERWMCMSTYIIKNLF